MQVSLTIIRYPKNQVFFSLLAMAVHRLPLWMNKNISFFKLMGSGKNGTFDKHPDWQQWAILTAFSSSYNIINIKEDLLIQHLYGRFISRWLLFFNCETYTILLTPIEGHGSWDGSQPFGPLPKQSPYDGTIAVLTRATIRLTRLQAFWKNVDKVAVQMNGAKGFITSYGIGEVPFIKQATFSIWQSKQSMKEFAYQLKEHSEVIKKTRKENWYSEDMFVRFKIVQTFGTVNGNDPLKGKL